ncbi:MAG: HD domain-containing phosphohydrolase [Burkholderiales bacterium]
MRGHERMDGKGYPRGRWRHVGAGQNYGQSPIAIAGIFEALTAKGRRYKDATPLTEAVQILAKFSLNGHIDPDLFHVHPREGLPALRPCFSECGTKDAIDLANIPGSQARSADLRHISPAN